MKPIFFVLLACLLSSVVSWGQDVAIFKSQTIIERNGKFGLLDAENKIVVEPICDEIVPSHNQKEYPVEESSRVFMLRKGDKWALTYYVDFNCHKKYATDSVSYWFKSDFIYEDFIFFKNKVTWGSGSDAYVIVGYKLEGKWGLFCIAGVRAALPNFASMEAALSGNPRVPGCLGPMHVIAAQYDEIVLGPPTVHHLNNYFASLNGKWRILVPVKEDKLREYIDSNIAIYSRGAAVHIDYGGDYDEPPTVFEKPFDRDYEYETREYRGVKTKGKRGIIKLEADEGGVSQVIPCHCDTVSTLFLKTAREKYEAIISEPDQRLFFFCVIKTNTFDSLVIYDGAGRRRSSVMSDRNSDLDDWYLYVHFVETSPEGTEKPFQYVYVAVSNYKLIDKGYGITKYILFSDTGLIGSYEKNDKDKKDKKDKKYQEYLDEMWLGNTVDIYDVPIGLLVLVRTNLDNVNIKYEFFDGLNNELKCSFELSPKFTVKILKSKIRLGYDNRRRDIYDYYCTVDLMTYPGFKVKKRYYYDFKKKCFIKGSLPKENKRY